MSNDTKLYDTAAQMVTLERPKSVWVRETRFGRWFLSTSTWYRYVLSHAVYDFKRLLAGRLPQQGCILDAGCGEGLAFSLIEEHFKPAEIVGIEIDVEQVKKASTRAVHLMTPTRVILGNASTSGLARNSFDMIFCHQLLHHTSEQTGVLTEFYQLLKPGGILLVGESCRSFINSLPVRLLFRHPHMAQQDAEGYVNLVKTAGFPVNSSDVFCSRPWWSRRCLGLAQKCGIKNDYPATEILIVAVKPFAAG